MLCRRFLLIAAVVAACGVAYSDAAIAEDSLSHPLAGVRSLASSSDGIGLASAHFYDDVVLSFTRVPDSFGYITDVGIANGDGGEWGSLTFSSGSSLTIFAGSFYLETIAGCADPFFTYYYVPAGEFSGVPTDYDFAGGGDVLSFGVASRPIEGWFRYEGPYNAMAGAILVMYAADGEAMKLAGDVNEGDTAGAALGGSNTGDPIGRNIDPASDVSRPLPGCTGSPAMRTDACAATANVRVPSSIAIQIDPTASRAAGQGRAVTDYPLFSRIHASGVGRVESSKSSSVGEKVTYDEACFSYDALVPSPGGDAADGLCSAVE